MNCPVCNRNLASTLSICPSCGAMMHDSVREDLHDKISPIVRTVKNEMRGNEAVPNKPLQPLTPKPALPSVNNPPLPSVNVNQPQLTQVKADTAEIAAKATSPTLVEFQNKNATLPEWRLQLQNAVRKRRDNTGTEPIAPAKPQPVVQKVLATNGSAALKAEIIEHPAPLPTGNAKLENALRRIEESRRKFLLEEREEVLPKAEPTAPPPGKNYPFYIASKNAEILPKPAEPKAEISTKPAELKTVAASVPIIEDLPIIEKKDFDTNKLKSLPNSSIISSNIGKVSTGELIESAETEAPRITISRAKTDDDEEFEIEETSFENESAEEEIEAFAPLSMRFNSAVFDLIIGAFASLILLAPFMLTGGRWLSIAGVLAFLVTCTIVMFIYLTTAVGFFGQTIGMKLFSLEIIDIQEEEYPTLHQAAVNSSVYLVSLVFGGIGFLPALFNEEKRAAHDLLSGTIVVREEG